MSHAHLRHVDETRSTRKAWRYYLVLTKKQIGCDFRIGRKKRQRVWNECNRNHQQSLCACVCVWRLCFNDILCLHRLSTIGILPLLGRAILQFSITRSCYLQSRDYVANWVAQTLTCASDIIQYYLMSWEQLAACRSSHFSSSALKLGQLRRWCT